MTNVTEVVQKTTFLLLGWQQICDTSVIEFSEAEVLASRVVHQSPPLTGQQQRSFTADG